MDLNRGVLSYEGLEVLRQVQTGGKKYYSHCLLPSPATLKNVSSKVKKIGDILLPFKTGRNSKGHEFIKFDSKRLLALVLNAYKLGPEVTGNLCVTKH